MIMKNTSTYEKIRHLLTYKGGKKRKKDEKSTEKIRKPWENVKTGIMT